MTFHHLFITVPQGTDDSPKKESLFKQFLENFYNTVKSQSISLEYLGWNNYTYCYIVVPDDLLETVEGLVYSTFPDCEIKRTEDYTNRIQANDHIAGTTLELERSDIYPFLTYSDFEDDSQSGLFAINSKVPKGEMSWVQIIMFARDDNSSYHFTRRWRTRMTHLSEAFSIKDRLHLKGRKGVDDKRKTAAQEKHEFNPCMAQIRVAYVAKDPETAKRKLNAIAHSFFRFNNTDLNGFTKGKINTSAHFINQYRSRQASQATLFSTKEIATFYHLPNADYVPNIVHVLARKAEPPQDVPKADDDDVSAFGITNYHNSNIPFGINYSDRRRHLYVVGKSGSGKSKFLELLIKNDLERGKGVGVLDPHGDLVDNILRFVPEHRVKDVIYFDPGDTAYPIAFNPLEKVDEAFKMQITIGFIQIFKKLFGSNWTDRLEHVLRYTTLALLDSPNTTVLSILKMLTDKTYRQRIVSRIQDSVVKNFWVSEFAGWSEKFDAEAITPLLNKVGQFVATNMIRNIIGQPINKFNIRDVMDGQKILLLKVSKGLLGEENSSLIGSMIITKLYQAAMQRADMPEEQRKDFYFYVDEFQNFATNTFAEILSEARKYRLNMTIAHQYMGQLIDEVQKTVFGNVGSMVSFRVGAEDAIVLEEEYTPIFKKRDIINLGVREFYTKMSVNGEIRKAFSGKTMGINYPEKDFSKEIIENSRKMFCSPVKDVETLLNKWDESGEFEDAIGSRVEDMPFEEPLI